MYNYISIILCIILIAIALTTTKNFLKNIINPLLIFGIIWFLILWFNSLHLFNLNKSEDGIYFMILIGIISFLLGYLIVYMFKKRYRLIVNYKYDKLKSNSYKQYSPRYKLLCILGTICIVYYIKNFITVVNLLLQGNDLSIIREMAQDSESILNIRSNIENAIRILFILPWSMALEAIVAVDFWKGKRYKPLLIICIIIIVLRVITDGGRTPIVNFMIYFIVSYILSMNKEKNIKIQNKKSKNKRWYLIIGMIIGVIILYYTTISRAGKTVLKTTYYYFAMEPYMFDIWSRIVNNNNLVGFGLASMNGFVFPVLYLLKNILGIGFPKYWSSIYDMILLTDSKWQIITETGISANAYVSMFWFFYLDGRVLGIVIGALVYGMIACSTYFAAMKYNTSKHICIYALILQGLFFSFIRFPFTNLYYSLEILFVIFIAYRPIEGIKN